MLYTMQSIKNGILKLNFVPSRGAGTGSQLWVLGSQIDGKFQKAAKSSKRTVLNQKVGRSP